LEFTAARPVERTIVSLLSLLLPEIISRLSFRFRWNAPSTTLGARRNSGEVRCFAVVAVK
jgi:hypothetical protein